MKPKKGLKFKITFAMFWLIVLMGVVLTIVSYRTFYNTYIKFYNEKAQNIVHMAAQMVDAERISQYTDSKETDDYYDSLLKRFNIIKSSTSELRYLYLFVPREDSFVYILDAYTENDDLENIAKFGEVFEYGETEYQYLVPDIKAKKASTDIIYGEDVGYGRSLSAWAPVLDTQGNLVAMVEADYILVELENEINKFMIKVIFFLICSLIFILAILIRIMKRSVTAPLATLTAYVNSYKKGEFAAQPGIYKSDDEMKWLSESFQSMITRINEYVEHIEKVTAEKERIGAELSVATQIQADMLPCIFPAFPDRSEFDIFATMTPAKEVGGDFYDFFMIDDSHLAMVMADVSGKGVPAALFMVIGKTLIKDCTQPGISLGDVFTKVNDLLCESNKEGLFITAFEGILDLKTGELRYVNAGHEPPFIRKKDQQYVMHKLNAGFVLAGMEGMKYKEGSLHLDPGDSIFLYTDGVTEATNAEEKLFDMERLDKVLNDNKDKQPNELLPAVKQQIDIFVGEAPQFDDITMLCVEYKEKMEGMIMRELTITAKVDNLEQVLNFLEEEMEAKGLSLDIRMQVQIAAEEIFVNIASYAYGDRTGEAVIRVDIEEGEVVRIVFKDKGVPYNPLEKTDPDVTLSLDEREIGGLGIFMVKQSMDRVYYAYEEEQNILTIERNLK